MKRKISFIMLLVLSFVLCACTTTNSNGATQDSYVSIDINPSIELIVSKDNKVVSIYATNDDARVLLAGEETFVGVSLDEAVERILDLCVEYEYLTEENSDVQVSVSSPDGENIATKIETNVTKVVEDTSKGFTFDVKVTSGLTDELQIKYELLKSELDNEVVSTLTINKFKLAESAASSDPTLDIKVAVTLNEEELIKRINDCRDEAYNYATATYNKMVEKVESVYSQLKKAYERGKFSAYYITNFKTHMVNYGLLYALYGSTADAIEAVLELQGTMEEYVNNALTEEQINQIIAKFTELEIAADEVREGIKDENGNITIESIKAYLDKVIASVEDEELKAQIEEVRATITSIEETLQAQYAIIEEKYLPQLNVMITTLQSSLQAFEVTFKGLSALIPQSVKDAMNEFVNETELLVSTMQETLAGKPTVEDLEGWVDAFREKEAQLLEKIKEDLGDEFDKVNSSTPDMPQELVNAESEFNKMKEVAMTVVEAELLKIKGERKNK